MPLSNGDDAAITRTLVAAYNGHHVNGLLGGKFAADTKKMRKGRPTHTLGTVLIIKEMQGRRTALVNCNLSGEFVHGLKNLHDVADITSTYEDLRWWFIFLNHWNGKGLLTFGPATAHFELGIQLSAVRSDASSKLGYGILYDNEWCAGSWPHSLDPEAIHIKEAIPLVIAASIWGKQWSCLHINFETDNAAVAHAVNNGLPHNRQLRSLVRLLWLQALKHNFHHQPFLGNQLTLGPKPSTQTPFDFEHSIFPRQISQDKTRLLPGERFIGNDELWCTI